MNATDLDPTARVPQRGHYTAAAARARLDWVRCHTGAALDETARHGLDPEALRGNVENFVGAVQVPVGVAGPLLFCGEAARGPVLAPFATTEGALVASACRGARALTLAGGVTTRVLGQQMVRAPVFAFESMVHAAQFARWLEGETGALRAAVRTASQRADLVRVQPVVLGRSVHARFCYRTADAAGQNMTTAATHRACRWILQHLPADTGLTGHHIEGNLSSDKKAGFLSFTDGRGTRVAAEARISGRVLQDVLKVDARTLLTTWQDFVAGSVAAGLIGLNVNVANTVAALFLATGQDVACVHESAVAHLDLRPDGEDGVYAALTLPALIVGTVGGGTSLPAQREALAMMGCYDARTDGAEIGGDGKSGRLAEIVAGFALALDLSTLAAIAAGHFAAAHERLGRNRPGLGIQTHDLGAPLLARVLQAEIEHAEPLAFDASDSILTDVAATELTGKRVGLFPFHVRYRQRGELRDERLLLKSKATDVEVIGALYKMAQGCGGALAEAFGRFGGETDFAGCHRRELAVASLTDDAFTRIAPRTAGTLADPDREVFVLAMEWVEDATHVGTAGDPSAWDEAAIGVVLRDLAPFHALHLGRTDGLAERLHAAERTAGQTARLAPLWHALAEHGAREFPALYPPKRARLIHTLIDAIPSWWPALEAQPRTLVHNDFNPRNLCLRRPVDQEGAPGPRLCAYDWELAAVHAPQHDLAEFLAFALPPDTPRAVRWGWVDRYREHLERAADRSFDPQRFRDGFDLASADLLVGRMGLYAMAHYYKDYAFLPRVLDGLFRWVTASPALAGFRPVLAGETASVPA